MIEIENVNQDYTDAAERFTAAYGAFRQTYEAQYPAPLKPQEVKGGLTWKIAGMITGLIGSIIVSASHTIPVFVGAGELTILTVFIGIAVFTMIEFSIVVFAYSSTEQQHKTRENIRERVKNYTRGGLFFIVGVAIAANVVYVIEHNITIPAAVETFWNGIRLVIYLAVGFSAPVIAFLTGEILAVDVLEHSGRFNRLLSEYETKLADWQAGLNTSWSRQQKKWGASIDMSERVSRLSNQTVDIDRQEALSMSNQTDNRQTNGGAAGFTRQAAAVDSALQYLADNPQAAALSARALMAEMSRAGVKVGKDSANKALNIYRAMAAGQAAEATDEL